MCIDLTSTHQLTISQKNLKKQLIIESAIMITSKTIKLKRHINEISTQMKNAISLIFYKRFINRVKKFEINFLIQMIIIQKVIQKIIFKINLHAISFFLKILHFFHSVHRNILRVQFNIFCFRQIRSF